MVRIKLSICIIIGLFIFSCTRKQDMLTIKRQNYMGNELRIDGFYYSKEKVRNEDHYTIYFFYRNGVLFQTAASGTLSEVILELNNDNYDYKNEITSWGVFVINNNIITIEKWWPGNGYNAPVVKTMGIIKNDTTFSLERSSYKDYFFTPFSPKPDSTNTFIK